MQADSEEAREGEVGKARPRRNGSATMCLPLPRSLGYPSLMKTDTSPRQRAGARTCAKTRMIQKMPKTGRGSREAAREAVYQLRDEK